MNKYYIFWMKTYIYIYIRLIHVYIYIYTLFGQFSIPLQVTEKELWVSAGYKFWGLGFGLGALVRLIESR